MKYDQRAEKHSNFRLAYQLPMADELLRYTSRGVVDIARRCGFGSRTNLYFAYQRDLRTTLSDRREQLMQQGIRMGI